MLPQILKAALPMNRNDNSAGIEYEVIDDSIVVAIIGQVSTHHVTFLRRNLIKLVKELNATVCPINVRPTVIFTFYESGVNTDLTLHFKSIISKLALECKVVVELVSGVRSDIAGIISCNDVSEVIWDASSYLDLRSLKETAKAKSDNKISHYGKVFIPIELEGIRSCFNIDLSDVDEFEDIYSLEGIKDILTDKVMAKSVFQ